MRHHRTHTKAGEAIILSKSPAGQTPVGVHRRLPASAGRIEPQRSATLCQNPILQGGPWKTSLKGRWARISSPARHALCTLSRDPETGMLSVCGVNEGNLADSARFLCCCGEFAPHLTCKKPPGGLVSVTVIIRDETMSHIVFPGSILRDERIWTVLCEIDLAEAARCGAAGCRLCGHRLHSATYPRKPHGLAPSLGAGVRRLSFCCCECRSRTTPPSVRFFGRRFRVAPVFVGLSVRLLGGSAPVGTASRLLGVPVSTLRRWRRWWRTVFPATPQWRWKRGELTVLPDDVPLVRLVRSMRGRSLRSRVLRVVVWLMPWTGWCGLDDGPAAPAESVCVAMR